MALHAATLALKAELETPSVTGRRPIADTIKTQRAVLLTLLSQIDATLGPLIDAIEDETNDAVAGKYESARQTMVALKRHCQNIDDHQHKLSVALRNWETEKADIVATITREE